MTESRKRTAAETWRALEATTAESEDEAKLDAEMERVLSLSDEEVARELAANGLDPEALRARGEELAREATRAPGRDEAARSDAAPIAAPAPAVVATSNVHAIDPHYSRRPPAWLLLIAAALAIGAVLVWKASQPPPNVAAPPPLPSGEPEK
jgi:hypothetical protein